MCASGRAGRELPGVAEQVLEDDVYERGVALGDESFLDGDVDHPIRLRLAQLRYHAPGDGREVDFTEFHLPAPDPGEREEGVDQLAHRLRRGADALQVVSARAGR